MPGGVLALWPDLMFSTRMQDAGRRLGVTTVVTQRVEELVAQAQAAGAQIVMVRSEFSRQLLALLTRYGS